MTKSQEQRMNELANQNEHVKRLVCLVPKRDIIYADSTLLSDHESDYYCGCEIRDIFKSGYQAAIKEAEELVEALNKIEEILCSQTYNDAFEIVEEALKEFRGE